MQLHQIRIDRSNPPATESPGRRFWRSIDELHHAPGREPEFAPQCDIWPDDLSRREFVRLTAASLALAGLTACTRQPPEKIVPYVRQPEQVIPGRPLYFATTDVFRGFGRGVIVESHEGRPTKVEGNPGHPASRGATDVFAQAAVLGLYDPDRSRAVREAGVVRTWPAFVDALRAQMDAAHGRRGSGLAILTGNTTSPTLAHQMQRLLADLPEARRYVHEPVPPVPHGVDLQPCYRLERAQVIACFDCDLIYSEPGAVRYARDYADGRRVRRGAAAMNRMYVAEPMPTVTGAAAEHRLPARSSDIAALLQALAELLGVTGAADGDLPAPDDDAAAWLDALADDLRSNRGAGVVAVGPAQPAALHRLARAINASLGAIGSTVQYLRRFDAAGAPESRTLAQLVDDMDAGSVDQLLIVDCNPVYTAPVDLQFARRLRNVRWTAHHGLYVDETARLCDWHVPATHPLESWSDARAHDGTASIVQPLIAPMYQGRTVHELLAVMLGDEAATAHDLVRAHWMHQHTGGDFEQWWSRVLHDGVMAQSQPAPVEAPRVEATRIEPAPRRDGIELHFQPDPCVWDGRFTNNGWLQELPRPVSKLTWDNAAMLSPNTAEQLGVESQDVLAITVAGETVHAPVWIVPGHCDGVITLPLGYGRTDAGRVARGAGFNAYPLRRAAALWHTADVDIRRTGRTWDLATTQKHQRIEGRDMLRLATLEQFRRAPEAVAGPEPHGPPKDVSLYEPFTYTTGHKWGMSIDLTTCIGCNACTIACQAENNIPIVGKQQVRRGREMHWIRVDRYYEGGRDQPKIHHQPMPCMQCEHAPCELVCPVGATIHSSEGLNQMTYNRCIGTRYCSNNCPYKVRRFNFLQFVDRSNDHYALQRNPDVTVRSRGVMEKCTYCVQRIERARIDAAKENRPIAANAIRTACQAVCPTNAIVFGDLNNPASDVVALARQPHDYHMLAELNTRPRTSYLVRVINPNPRLHEGGRDGR